MRPLPYVFVVVMWPMYEPHALSIDLLSKDTIMVLLSVE